MVLSDADIEKFQALYKSKFGMEISREDAYEKGIKLLGLMSAIYRPKTEKEYERIQKYRKDTPQLQKQQINNHEKHPKEI